MSRRAPRPRRRPDSTGSPTNATATTDRGQWMAAPDRPGDTPATTAPPASAPAAANTPAPAVRADHPVRPADISGKWIGSWVGTGLFNSPRQENLTLDLAQKGEAGYGRMVLDGATAAESVPWDVRQQGLGGIRVLRRDRRLEGAAHARAGRPAVHGGPDRRGRSDGGPRQGTEGSLAAGSPERLERAGSRGAAAGRAGDAAADRRERAFAGTRRDAGSASGPGARSRRRRRRRRCSGHGTRST